MAYRQKSSPAKKDTPIKDTYRKAVKPAYRSLRRLEDSLGQSLGGPMEKANVLADKFTSKNKGNWVDSDKIRHGAAGMYTKEAISKKLGGGLFAKAAGIIGSNALGVGHELSSFNTDHGYLAGAIEGAKDLVNNFIGSISNKKNVESNIKRYGNSGMSSATRKERVASMAAERVKVKNKSLKK